MGLCASPEEGSVYKDGVVALLRVHMCLIFSGNVGDWASVHVGARVNTYQAVFRVGGLSP